jgi:hypothetical protein
MARKTDQLTATRVQQLISAGERGSYHDGTTALRSTS